MSQNCHTSCRVLYIFHASAATNENSHTASRTETGSVGKKSRCGCMAVFISAASSSQPRSSVYWQFRRSLAGGVSPASECKTKITLMHALMRDMVWQQGVIWQGSPEVSQRGRWRMAVSGETIIMWSEASTHTPRARLAKTCTRPNARIYPSRDLWVRNATVGRHRTATCRRFSKQPCKQRELQLIQNYGKLMVG